MKEYKFLKKGTFQKEKVIIEEMQRLAKEGWQVVSVIGDMNGIVSRIVLERNKNRF